MTLDLGHLGGMAECELTIEWDADVNQRAVTMPYRFNPRNYQEEIWEEWFGETYRRFAVVWHRRSGKSRNAFCMLAASAALEMANYLYVMPTAVQARKVVWDGIGADGMRYIDHIPQSIAKRSSQRMSFEFASGSILQVVGADNPDSVRGTNPKRAWLDEFQDINPLVWDILRPIFAENGGSVGFSWTPKGRNHAYRLEEAVKRNPRWYFSKLDVTATERPDGSPVICEEEIEAEKEAGMSTQMVLQEFYLSYDAGNEGAYYAHEMLAAHRTGRIGFVPIEPSLPVHTFWDLGVSDYMAIWFLQVVGKECRFVYCYQDTGYAFPHYWNHMQEWAQENGVRFGEHWAPHDIEVREMGTTDGGRAKSRKELAAKIGLKFHRAPRIKKMADGREAVRAILPRCWFNERGCDAGLSALQEYGPKWDEKRGIFLDEPDHNWASHFAKAFETFAVGWKDRLWGPGTNRPHHTQRADTKRWDALEG